MLRSLLGSVILVAASCSPKVITRVCSSDSYTSLSFGLDSRPLNDASKLGTSSSKGSSSNSWLRDPNPSSPTSSSSLLIWSSSDCLRQSPNRVLNLHFGHLVFRWQRQEVQKHRLWSCWCLVGLGRKLLYSSTEESRSLLHEAYIDDKMSTLSWTPS